MGESKSWFDMNECQANNENHIIHFHHATETRLVYNFPASVCECVFFLSVLLNELAKKIMHKLLHLTSLIESSIYKKMNERIASPHNAVQWRVNNERARQRVYDLIPPLIE